MQESLQEYLVRKFQDWRPQAPEVVERTKRSVTLRWMQAEPFEFMREHLLYKVQKKEKIPSWVTVYSGGKTIKTIEDLAPSHPHKFRLQVIVKSTAVTSLAEEALKHYGDENVIYNNIDSIGRSDVVQLEDNKDSKTQSEEEAVIYIETLKKSLELHGKDDNDPERMIESPNNKEDSVKEDTIIMRKNHSISLENEEKRVKSPQHPWLESRWSEETWTSTDTDGTSSMCFCMGVRCGYFKQVQTMLEERPVLIGAINSSTGLTPLATAINKGDLNTVKFVLSLGADVDQQTSCSQSPLHLAVLAGHTAIVDALLERGADFQARDFNGLRVEHYAVDSCQLDMVKHVMDRGGNVHVKDCNGWTPLFRAVCQGAKTEVIEELLLRGSSVEVIDRRGLALVAAARLLRNRQGRSRDSVLRLVDSQFPHEKALANFTRLTKKIYSVHTLLK